MKKQLIIDDAETANLINAKDALNDMIEVANNFDLNADELLYVGMNLCATAITTLYEFGAMNTSEYNNALRLFAPGINPTAVSKPKKSKNNQKQISSMEEKIPLVVDTWGRQNKESRKIDDLN